MNVWAAVGLVVMIVSQAATFAHIEPFWSPLPGYLGFPAFALECFAMYVFLRTTLGALLNGVRHPASAQHWRSVCL